jgi:DNA-binding transcriptional regulator YiaG
MSVLTQPRTGAPQVTSAPRLTYPLLESPQELRVSPDDLVVVVRWNGHQAAALRQALRFSLVGFAHYLGVAKRTVSKWEARGEDLEPTPDAQAILDTALEKASPQQRARFAFLCHQKTAVIVIRPAQAEPAPPMDDVLLSRAR